MIVYQPNKHFLGDINHLAKSWTMVKIVRGVLLMGAFALLVCGPIVYFGVADQIVLSSGIFSFLGVVLSILLVFRTNAAYDRWWEARKQWGALVNHTRNMAIYVHSMFPKEDDDSRRFMASHIANFCFALAEHLRQGVVLDHLIYLTPELRAEYEGKDHIPNHIALQIFQRINQAYRKGDIDMGDYINIKAQHQALLDILGACERIKKTPIPFSYAVFVRIFILAYSFLLPVALVSTFGLWTIPLVMLIFFAFLGVELMAGEIEDPFGLDCNDLPTGNIAHTIKKNIFEILESRTPTIKSESPALYEKIF